MPWAESASTRRTLPRIGAGRAKVPYLKGLSPPAPNTRRSHSMARPAASENGTPVNKSEAVRGFMAAHPQAGTKDVVAGLAEKGIHVTSALGYLIKRKEKQA